MLLEHTAKRSDLALTVSSSVEAVLNKGLRTGDIAKKGEPVVGTAAMGDAVVAELTKKLG